MLYALFGEREVKLVLRQKRLGEVLGVTRPTVSRMSRSLETLGLLTRTRSERDRRNVILELTKMGYRLIKRVHKRWVKAGWAELAVSSALGHADDRDRDANRWWDAVYCKTQVDMLEGLLHKMRHEYCDVGSLYYPRWSRGAASPAPA
jgi:DNA-binding MarR family transcriptional regulator